MSSLAEHVQRHVGPYDPDGEVDLPGLAGSLTVFGTSALAVAWGVARRGTAAEPRTSDVLLGGVAVHKLSRLLAKGEVTSPLRAPFTEFEGAAGAAEHHESPRGERGVRHTVGELLTCPFCLATWLSSGYVVGLLTVPRATRACASVLAVTAVSDFLQHAYARVRT